MRILASLLAMTLLAVAGSALATAQTVQFTDVVTGDRTVTLHWDPAPGDTLTPAERARDATRLFARYRLWRSGSGEPGSFQLARSYSLYDTTWTFSGDIRVFSDPASVIPRGTQQDPDAQEVAGPFNGFPYWYALTWDEAVTDSSSGTALPVYFQMQEIEDGIQGPIFPQSLPRTADPLLAAVEVVPNPYNPAAAFGQGAFPGPARVQFRNLPARCTIQIYTVSGDLVRRLEHDQDEDSEDWDLRNQNGSEVSSGVYIWYITSGDQKNTGRFVIVR